MYAWRQLPEPYQPPRRCKPDLDALNNRARVRRLQTAAIGIGWMALGIAAVIAR